MRRRIGKYRVAAVVGMSAALTLAALVADGHAQEIKPQSEKEIAAQGGVQLTGPQVVATLTGNTAYAMRLTGGPTLPKGTVVPLFYRDARTRVARGPTVIEAPWWTDGNQVCADNKVEKIGHVCGTMHRLGNGFYFCERSTRVCEWYFRVVPGNAEKL